MASASAQAGQDASGQEEETAAAMNDIDKNGESNAFRLPFSPTFF
jgi:hypothetical protein